MIGQDQCQTLQELSESLNVEKSYVSRRLHSIGQVHKLGNWVPHELTERAIANRLTMSELLLKREKKEGIFASNYNWRILYYDNPKRLKAWVKPGEPGPLSPKRNIHCSKLMLCIWLDQKAIVYNKLLQPGTNINA